jgi:hypothetical protein
MKISLKQPLIAGLVGAVMGFIISASFNYYVIPIPGDIPGHAINNGMSGLFSGFMGGFPGVLMYMIQERKKQKQNSL